MKGVFSSVLIGTLVLCLLISVISCGKQDTRTPSQIVYDDVHHYLTLAFSGQDEKLKKEYGKYFAAVGVFISDELRVTSKVTAYIEDVERMFDETWATVIIDHYDGVLVTEAQFFYYLRDGKWELTRVTHQIGRTQFIYYKDRYEEE